MQWTIINIILQITGVWIALALKQMSNKCQDTEWMECLSSDLQWDSPWDMNTNQIYEWKNQALGCVQLEMFYVVDIVYETTE